MATNVNETTIEVILPNQIGYERIAMASSASFAKMFGYSPARIEDLKTVVAEAAVNAMQHGNKGRPDGRVTIQMNLKDDTIYITVTDDGEGIKNIHPKPDIDRIIDKLDPPTGFGTFLIKQLVNDVDFNVRTEKGHGLRMAIKKSKSNLGRV
jgi:anti-sigma regulatory factor (Ser/Thr protein kinase)